jgi:hypothetical protein
MISTLMLTRERTFCTTFAYPSFSTEQTTQNGVDLPEAFQPLEITLSEEENLNLVFGQNEESAITLFVDMINLVREKDAIINETTAQSMIDLDNFLNSALGSRDETLLGSTADMNLRKSISVLAHNNAIQVIAFRLQPTLPPIRASLLSARTSLRIVFDTATSGLTMCLWMWVYYTFTAAVVVFLHTIAEPLHSDAVLDLALLSDLQELCRSMSSFSDGAMRIGEMTGHMEKLALDVMKTAARANAKKRTAEEPVDRPADREKIRKIATPDFQEVTPSAGGLAGSEQNSEVSLRQLLDSTPQNLDWDDWDQWLADVPFLPD